MLGRPMAPTTSKLYALPASHPCAAVEAALRLKSLDFERVDLLPLTQLLVGPLRYGGRTVPGMRIDGERLVGSRAIMRRLDELAPEPPLLPPPGTPAYARVLEAERWGDEILQGVPRRVLDLAFVREPTAMLSYAADAKLPLPLSLLRPAAPLTARLMALQNGARENAVRADLAALPAQLDRVDRWIDEALLGGERPTAADLQIGSTIRLLATIADVRPAIQGRPAARLADYFPPLAGEVPPATLPAGWLSA
ncbi:MAG: glutathione S-transferase [Solirubrobacterales bacterium]|jgi:glutathione S-transferase|nr:glutathione S-transferase [Solirubrobacterales bacterium]